MNAKSLHNIMKRKLKQAGDKFPELKTLHAHEIKAKDAYPCVKYHILESILSKDVTISYIVVDLHYTEERLLKDKNIFHIQNLEHRTERIDIQFQNRKSLSFRRMQF